jgi:hypothetical protein
MSPDTTAATTVDVRIVPVSMLVAFCVIPQGNDLRKRRAWMIALAAVHKSRIITKALAFEKSEA